MSIQLGKLKKIDNLRKIWPDEAANFTPWLANKENLNILSETLNIDIICDEKESSVGSFHVDLFCHEDITNRRIIIENQLEETNHDHLGKIITYAAGKSAEILIWIVKHAREEHMQAVEWLNEHTDNKISIFLVEIELWEIDNSSPAVNFNVVERPNNWAKTVKSTEILSATKKMNYAFWQEFVDYARNNREFMKDFKVYEVKAAQNSYYLAVGSSLYYILMTMNTRDNKITTGIIIREDKNLYKTFESHKDEIEKESGLHFDWQLTPEYKVSRIETSLPCDVQDEDKWPEFFKWLCETNLKIKKEFVKWV